MLSRPSVTSWVTRRWTALTSPGVVVERTATPPTKLGYQPVLDGLRAVAVFLVVLYHALPGVLPGGWIGVDIFFALSGFLITSLLLFELRERSKVLLGQFYLRRLARLMPAVAALLVIYVSLTILTKTGGARRDVLHTAWLVATYRANLVGNPDATHGLGHMWSLAFEEQFYVVWPIVLLLVARRYLRWLPWLTAGGVVGCIAWRAVLLSHHASFPRVYYRPDTRVDSLLLGCLFGQLFVTGVLTAARLRPWVFSACLAALVTISLTVTPTEAGGFVGTFTIIGGAASLLVVTAVLNPPRLARRVLSSVFPRAIGRLSYSLYLWHLPILLFLADTLHLTKFVVAAVGIPLSLAVALASYCVVEQPFLALKARLQRRSEPMAGDIRSQTDR